MITHRLIGLVLFICISLKPVVQAVQDNKRMFNDIEAIQNVFQVKDAPAEWKKEYAGWDLSREVERVKSLIQQQDLSIRDYQKLLLSFFHSMKDYHVMVNFYATEMSILPFRLHGAKGRYFIAWLPGEVGDIELDPEMIRFLKNARVGDEVISLNGVSAEAYVQDFCQKIYGNETNGTDQMLAEQYLTLRLAEMGHSVEEGPIEIRIKHQNSEAIDTYVPEWIYVPEEIKNDFPSIAAKIQHKKNKARKEFKFFKAEKVNPIYPQVLRAQKSVKKAFKGSHADTDFFILGQHKSFVPPLGPLIWEDSHSHHYSYIFQWKGKKIGYVRIPTYAVFGYEYRDFEKVMRFFQQETDALVIDQLNNPGGMVVYLFALLSMLTDQPLELPLERITITQQDVSEALDILDSPEEYLEAWEQGMAGYSISKEDSSALIAYFKNIIQEWNSGRIFTAPLYYYGISSVKPHPEVRYTKPILVLVNALDFSCADFFPAILQDNGRAKIFGSKTAGAGGYVLNHEYPNLFGIKGFSYTGSIAYRTNQQPLENLGVTPDFVYEMTDEDLMNNYQPYSEALLKALDSLL